ncbi:HAMP domain-containing sensor histidine kinase [Paenibacillus sp. UMB4589-SE434]|uniref:sensor histidine kinase n=1 Tax=Paenibacillus sp. UMB4589-SE434 TaxID=3046314 RepID=UPI0025504A7E|nr:HAMP domain-containing sensor histidine kinase [Paenibacillus sp. UMB4589-SE434]MDK8182846.1 HAMP domain-containing sensor histidine kinase [Paenibacillus sp. UMB4589-SE434]
MRPDRNIVLICCLLLALTFLLIHDIWNGPLGTVRGVLFIVIYMSASILLLARIRFVARLKDAHQALKRAVQGNRNTRLLANGEPLLNEVIFSINELIEQIDKLQVQTIRSEAARKSLLSNISHDIRTPLTSIIGYVDALMDDIADNSAERQAYTAIVLNKANNLKKLIDHLFDLSKLDADEIVMKPERLDLAELARECVIEFIPELRRQQLEVKASIPDVPCLIVADRVSMNRIISNIMKNAVQYGKDGKVVGLELTEYKQEYELRIWDQGTGIVEEDREKVFDRLYRTERSRSSLQGGSGLGLAIAKALIEKNGGAIWVTSDPGVCTTFGITIPKHP